MSTRILVIGFLTLAVIFVLYKMRKQKLTKDMMKEVMDEMFEVSSEISENTYIKIVNKMKEVYERL